MTNGTERYAAYELNRDSAPAYWQVDILWLILAAGTQTGGAFSLIEELCPKDSGPPPHTHTQLEVFYLIDGEITFIVEGKQIQGRPGSIVTVPPGSVHSFRVDSETCRVLNMYVPAGFERSIIELGEPALERALPPKGRGMAATMDQAMQLFSEIGMKPIDQIDTLRPSADARMQASHTQ